jgi:hypothetical protein
VNWDAVRKVSTNGSIRQGTPNFKLNLASEDCAVADSMRILSYAHDRRRNGDEMGVLIYIVLTVAVFALLGLTQKLVERL